MPDMDQGIKRLVQTYAADFLALALPGAEYLGTIPIDVATEPQLTLDTLLRVRYHGVECAVDLEAEARPKPDIGRRLFEYGARATIVSGLPVISVVLWLEPDGAAPSSPYELHAADRLVATWHFIGIELYQQAAEMLLGSGLVGLLPLVPFTRDVTRDVIERTADLVKETAPEADLGKLEALLLVFAGRKYDSEFLKSVARRLFMSTEILEKSSLYQEWVQAAREQGIEQGIEQGMASGLRDAALLTLRARLGELPQEMADAVAQAPVPVLQELLAHVTSDTPDQLRARLSL
ncbi:MAG TPA: hypothetical protein VF116_24030 [Ktedonobacterales bacterium]